MLDRAFKECLEAIPSGRHNIIERLKRFVTSKRIRHAKFLESKAVQIVLYSRQKC